MPRKVDPRQTRIPDDVYPPDGAVSDESDYVHELENKLQQRQSEMERLSEHIFRLTGGHGEPIAHGVMILILATVVIFRMAVYSFEEKLASSKATMPINVVFLLLGFVVLWKAVITGWSDLAWRVIPKCLVIGTALLGAAQIIADPDGGIVIGGLFVVAALIFAASPGFERSIDWLHAALNHPVETIRRFQKKEKKK